MKKHSLTIVFSLIILLSLVGAVSASDDISQSDVDTPAPSIQEDVSMKTVSDSNENYESSVSIASGEVSSDESSNSAILESESSDISRASTISVSNDDDVVKSDFKSSVHVSSDNHVLSSVSNSLDEEEPLEINPEGIISTSQDCDVQSVAVDLNIVDDGYELGYNVTTACCELFDFNSADDILVITTTELGKINDLTIENVLNGIINASNGYVTYDKDNLLLLSSITIDSTDIAFFIKKGESVSMALYENGELIIRYSSEDCLNLSAGLWSNLQSVLNDKDINSLVFIVNSWANGFLSDVLSLDSIEFTSAGLIDGQARIQLLNCYPPTNKFDLPLGDTSSDVLGVPRDSDDDAFIWTMHRTPGENAFIGVDMVNKSITGSLNLNLKSANSETQEIKASNVLTSNDIKRIGVDAAKKALSYFKSQGIDIQKDYPYLYVLTSAGYVKLNGLDTDSALEGIIKVLGSELGKTLLPIHTPLWKDLVFYFLWVNNINNKDYSSYGLKYDATDSKLVVSNAVKKQGDDFAYDMGLYKKQSKHHAPIKHHSKKITPKTSTIGQFLNTTADDNVTEGNTSSIVNSTASNSTNNTTAVSQKKFDDVAQPQAKNSNPVNILYTIAAIILIFVIFSVGNSKRFD